MKALIDLDPLPYSYGGLTFEDGGVLPDKLLRKMVDEKIKDITEKAGADDWVGYLTDSSSNFRLDVATILPYKGNRSGSEKPPKYQMLRDYLMDAYPDKVSMVVGMEADDQLAIDQWSDYTKASKTAVDLNHFNYSGAKSSDIVLEVTARTYCNTIICTIDKDLHMVPGWHYCWAKGNSPEVGPWLQTETGGLRCFYKQLLTGDTVDNIKGLHGVGKKSKLLDYIDECDDEWMMAAHVYGEYFKRFGHYAASFMRENATLLWMKRSEDDVFNYDHLLNTLAEARAPATHDWPPADRWSPFKEEEEETCF